MTAEKKMLAYARVCFEIKVNTNLPDNVLLLDEEGNQVIQKVEYEWILMACKVCEVFGHTYANCPKKTKVSQHWVMKKKALVIDCSAKGGTVAGNITSVNVNDKPMEPVCGGKRTTGIESRTVVTSSGNTDAVNMVVDSNKESRHSIIEIGECSKTAEVSF
ncbi:hypothetical protein LguiB_032635 [Lonicera macranthoides]